MYVPICVTLWQRNTNIVFLKRCPWGSHQFLFDHPILGALSTEADSEAVRGCSSCQLIAEDKQTSYLEDRELKPLIQSRTVSQKILLPSCLIISVFPNCLEASVLILNTDRYHETYQNAWPLGSI